MDSITQIVLGAACVAVLAPKAHTRRALLYGAALGTLPDLDALVPFADPLDSLILHRSLTHSVLVLPWLGLLLFYLFRRWDKALQIEQGRWLIGMQLALITHPLLDFFTTYGTQLFWPLTSYPFATGSVFIIDPVVTLPLLIACVIAWRRWKQQRSGLRALHIALGWSVFYLFLGLATQSLVVRKLEAELAKQSFANKPFVSVAAAPLTIWTQRVVVKLPDQYREAYVSIFDGSAPIRWASFRSDDSLLTNEFLQGQVSRLQAFSKGVYSVKLTPQQNVIITDLRMGSEPNYVFSYDFGPMENPYPIVKRLPVLR